jgi:mannose-6-phosphate isomerase-like protein (cupin superfamily)
MKKDVRLVSADQVARVTPYQASVPGFAALRMITKRRTGSDKLMVGIVEIAPAAKGYSWSYSEAEGNDEVYYVLQGRVKLHYDGRCIVAGRGDAIFLPAGRHYTLANAQSRPARLLYALTPPIE